jgi:hypothetical protein
MRIGIQQTQMLHKAYAGLIRIFMVLVLAEVFIAGLIIWGRWQESDIEAHRSLANIILIVAITLFVVALAARMPRIVWGLSLALALLVLLQGFWVEVGGRWVHAVHPTMTFVIMAIGNYLMRLSRHATAKEIETSIR